MKTCLDVCKKCRHLKQTKRNQHLTHYLCYYSFVFLLGKKTTKKGLYWKGIPVDCVMKAEHVLASQGEIRFMGLEE